MGQAADTGNLADTPSPGAAALMEALAGFSGAHDASFTARMSGRAAAIVGTVVALCARIRRPGCRCVHLDYSLLALRIKGS
jgi:hypothetical protein